MDGTARALEEIPAAMRVGVITDGAVRVGARAVTARRAASCLVVPRDGDRVLLAESAEGAWVLAVLSHEGATRLEVAGDLELATPTGRVTVAARDGVEAVTSGTVRVTAAEVAVHASVATAVVDAAEIVGGAVSAAVERWTLRAGTATTIAERLVQRARLAQRVVEELDQVRAGVLRLVGRESVQAHGRFVALTADELAKVDANQVVVG